MLGFKAFGFSWLVLSVCNVRTLICFKQCFGILYVYLKLGRDVPSMVRHYNVGVDTQHPTVETGN